MLLNMVATSIPITNQTPTNINGLLKGDGDNVSSATAGVDYAAPSKSVVATLKASDWNGNTQTITVEGMTISTNAKIGLGMSATNDEFTATQAAMLLATSQAENSITITAFGEVPTIDIPVTVLILG